MESELSQLKASALDKLAEIKAETKDALETLKQFEHKYLSRAGLIRQASQKIAGVEAHEKPKLGQLINQLKDSVTESFNRKVEELKKAVGPKAATVLFDATIPGEQKHTGRYHPLYQTFFRIIDVFRRLGFDCAYGPEIELPYYNFEALNVPADHPSCDAFDTFYVADLPTGQADSQRNLLLRSHTSPVQIRTMEKVKPPIRIIVPGKVFRPDAPTPSRFPMFHQVEGLMVDKDITFANLKGVLDIFCKEIFGPDTRTRFRPSFFPFTEPSAEVDISCVFCHGQGTTGSGENCPVCRGEGWIEILGCGMVHPNVLNHVKYDPEKYTGFAFGMGVERVAMLKHGINDIRLFTENHLNFLSQF
ncbi:MAG: phenylalanine--tRNA ligase subunit alpha [Planctomycetes bacterium]|nr:phenylalanine--tRNA ligase subunit alpha [Planctomycetota bacterium]